MSDSLLSSVTSAKLSPAKRRALLALVEHGSVSRAADACNLSRQSVYRYMRDAEFAAALTELSGIQVAAASRRLTSLLWRAIDELERLMGSDSEQQRRLAADSVLSHALRLKELVELEHRISNLEKHIGV